MLDLRDCYLKLEWAKKHIEDLEKVQATFLGSEPYKGVPDFDLNENMTFFHLKELPEIPHTISLYVGDAAHNLRTALDYLACALVVHNGHYPGLVYFPIAETAAKYRAESAKKTKGMSAEAKKVIDDLRPYADGNDCFYALHQLDIIDKHRLLLTVAMSIGKWSFNLSGQQTIVGFNMPHNRNEPFGLKRGDFIGTMFGNHVDKQMSATVDIALGEPELLLGRPVVETLKILAVMVAQILGLFESKFGAPAATG